MSQRLTLYRIRKVQGEKSKKIEKLESAPGVVYMLFLVFNKTYFHYNSYYLKTKHGPELKFPLNPAPFNRHPRYPLTTEILWTNYAQHNFVDTFPNFE